MRHRKYYKPKLFGMRFIELQDSFEVANTLLSLFDERVKNIPKLSEENNRKYRLYMLDLITKSDK